MSSFIDFCSCFSILCFCYVSYSGGESRINLYIGRVIISSRGSKFIVGIDVTNIKVACICSKRMREFLLNGSLLVLRFVVVK